MKLLLTTSKFPLSIFRGILIGLSVVAVVVAVAVVGLVGFVIFERKVCAPKIYTAAESFLAQAKNGNYEDFLNKNLKGAPVFLSREDFENFKRGASGKYSTAITEWEYGIVAFMRVEFMSLPAYDITLIPEDHGILLCLGKDYKALAVRQTEKWDR